MNEWKELKIDNLPCDILTGDYEFNWIDNVSVFTFQDDEIILDEVFKEMKISTLRCRKVQPKAPTHEEIMTKWWKDKLIWDRVMSYDLNRCNDYYELSHDYVDKEWFIGRESADIPPEV